MRFIARKFAERIVLGDKCVDGATQRTLLPSITAGRAFANARDEGSWVGRYAEGAYPEGSVIVSPCLLMARPSDQGLLEPRKSLEAPQDGSKVRGKRLS